MDELTAGDEMDGSTREASPAGGKFALLAPALSLAAYALFRGALELIRLPHGTPPLMLALASGVVALGSIGLPILVIATLVAGKPRAGITLLVAVAGLALWFGAVAAAPVFGRGFLPLAWTLQDVGKVLAAGGVGAALGRAIREPNILAPAGVFAAFADFVVVNFGTVHRALQTEKGQAMVAAVSAAIPAIHPRLTPLSIGPADFLFLGLFLMCAARFGMGLWKNGILLSVVLAASLLAVQADVVRAMPALAPMSIAFVAANWRSFRLSRQEVISTFVVIGLAGALFLGYFLFLFPKK